ncbi:MAG: hypothetical protein RBR06_01655 [Desulfuromonadaceae bacterium]|nr:hypothetical protein [Desulfuromonadaceae bacterium]
MKCTDKQHMGIKLRCSGVFLLLFVSYVLTSVAVASDWPQLESRLDTWDGAKEVQLPAGVDPIEDPVFAPVVEMLLRAGFAVRTDGDTATGDGLILTQRQSGDDVKIVLARARDGALLAVDPSVRPVAPAPQANVLSTAAIVGRGHLDVPAQQLRIASSATANTMGVRAAGYFSGGEMLIDIPGQPRSIAVWPAAHADSIGFHLFALYDKELVHFYCHLSSHTRQLERIAAFKPAVRVSRALRLTSIDLDGDNRPELAPVWVEDVHSVDEGVESRLHSWVMEVAADGSMQERSADLKGYLAEVNGKLRLQQRGEYSVFDSAVYAVSRVDGRHEPQYARSVMPLAEAGHWVLNHARWPDHDRILIWNDDERLVLAAHSNTAAADIYAGGTLLSDFGSYQGATIYIPLQEPIYRGGFSTHDRIMERKEHVPRRMLPYSGSLYTMVRGRDAGLPLVGRASGRDKLVQIVAVETGLQARSPFAPVDAYILDFALWQGADGVLQAVLLLNEKQDGSGRAYLQLQRAP